MAEPGMPISSGQPVMGKDPNGKAQHLKVGTDGTVAANHATTGIGDGKQTVVTPGTAVQLAAATAAKWVWVQAYPANTGRIAVGGATVNASTTIGTGRGGSLAAGDSVFLPVADLSNLYIDATVAGEGVRFTYGT